MIIQNSTKLRLAKTNPALMAGALLFSLVVTGVPAQAASQCKNLENNACTTNTACTWVQGYERKDGRTVKSFCRAKAKPKATRKSAAKS